MPVELVGGRERIGWTLLHMHHLGAGRVRKQKMSRRLARWGWIGNSFFMHGWLLEISSMAEKPNLIPIYQKVDHFSSKKVILPACSNQSIT